MLLGNGFNVCPDVLIVLMSFEPNVQGLYSLITEMLLFIKDDKTLLLIKMEILCLFMSCGVSSSARIVR